MSDRFLASMGSVVVIPFMLAAARVEGQLEKTAASAGAKTSSSLRTVNGHADLQGVWSFATLTPLQRPADHSGKETLTDEDVAKLEQQAIKRRDIGPTSFTALLDTPTKLATRRTSLIVDPPDGRVPPLTPEAQKRVAARTAANNLAVGPEDRRVYERCILGFNSGPPIIPRSYNQNLQIFQTRDHVVLYTEMVNDARIIPLDGRRHLTRTIRQWKGDSRGRWEGDTLVIETVNFTHHGTGTLDLDDPPGNRGQGIGFGDENMHLIERLTRVDADTVLYEFTITDPTMWTKPWTVQIPIEGAIQE